MSEGIIETTATKMKIDTGRLPIEISTIIATETTISTDLTGAIVLKTGETMIKTDANSTEIPRNPKGPKTIATTKNQNATKKTDTPPTDTTSIPETDPTTTKIIAEISPTIEGRSTPLVSSPWNARRARTSSTNRGRTTTDGFLPIAKTNRSTRDPNDDQHNSYNYNSAALFRTAGLVEDEVINAPFKL